MNRNALLAYQLITGVSDACTGALLMIVPGVTLALMNLPAPKDDLVYVSYIGSFVFAVGLCGLYGFRLVLRGDGKQQLSTVWLLTALMRSSVAVFVTQQVVAGTLASGWFMVAAFDGVCVVIQAIGLRKRWVAYAAR